MKHLRYAMNLAASKIEHLDKTRLLVSTSLYLQEISGNIHEITNTDGLVAMHSSWKDDDLCYTQGFSGYRCIKIRERNGEEMEVGMV